jgi:hypothetical protein
MIGQNCRPSIMIVEFRAIEQFSCGEAANINAILHSWSYFAQTQPGSVEKDVRGWCVKKAKSDTRGKP